MVIYNLDLPESDQIIAVVTPKVKDPKNIEKIVPKYIEKIVAGFNK